MEIRYIEDSDQQDRELFSNTVSGMGFLGGSAGKESTCNVGDLGSIPGFRRSLGEGNGYPVQYSGLEDFLRLAKSGTHLSPFHFTCFWDNLLRIYVCKKRIGSYLKYMPDPKISSGLLASLCSRNNSKF